MSTYNSPLPKKDILRPFPEAMPQYTENILVVPGETLERTLTPQPGSTDVVIKAQAGAHLTLMFAATYTEQEFRSITIHAELGKDAVVHLIDRAIGGARLETRVIFGLLAAGAEAKFTGMYHGRNAEHHACHVIVDHAVPSTRGDVYVRGVYEQEARGVFTGLIKVAPDAQLTRSYYRDDVLLLDRAIAESLPTLEIEANDVKASHGSTTSRMNDEQLFYLMSRGLPQAHARNLIVAGFLTPALKRMPEALCKPFLPTE